MKIACLMGTFGRYRLACESLACFLQQTELEQAHLTILNQHPIPLSFEHPRVTVFNEQMPRSSVRKIRLRMLELADRAAEYVHFWDDDDLYLPWHLEDCVSNIGDRPGWKPGRIWLLNGSYSPFDSYEGTAMYDAVVLRAAPVDTHPEVSDHPIYKQLIESGQMATTDLGDLTSYIYRWSTGSPHRSFVARDTAEAHDVQMDEFRRGLTDAGPTEMVVPDLWPHWQAFLDGIRAEVAPENLIEIERRLRAACRREPSLRLDQLTP